MQCPRLNCPHIYRAFPTYRATRLMTTTFLGQYQFICECDTYIDVEPSKVQISQLVPNKMKMNLYVNKLCDY
jgi:hypothetical protein